MAEVKLGNIKGPKGDIGARGLTGAKGDTGARGPQGVKGDTGPKGDTGATSYRARELQVIDTRNTNPMPGDFNGRTFQADFKRNAIIDYPPISTGSAYAHVITMNGWTGGGAGGGGETTQLAFGDSLAVRISESTNKWGQWKRLATIEDVPNTGTSLPTPSSSYRGRVFTLFDNTNGDRPYICIRNKNGSYSWEDVLGVFT